VHVNAMGLSYVLLLTAFYVDNGKNLPLWRRLPPIAYWVIPLDQTVTHYEPRRRLVWRHDTERLDGKPAPLISRETEFGIYLSDLAPGTLVQLTSRHLPGSVFEGLLVRLVAAPRIACMLERSLARIAEILAPRHAA
jgi:hypothetical protein